MTREYYEDIVSKAISNMGEKTYVDLLSEEDAATLVAAILLKPYEFELHTKSGVECVNARSIFGVLYFLAHRNNSYLVCTRKRAETTA